jgi:hypothetical protein
MPTWSTVNNLSCSSTTITPIETYHSSMKCTTLQDLTSWRRMRFRYPLPRQKAAKHVGRARRLTCVPDPYDVAFRPEPAAAATSIAALQDRHPIPIAKPVRRQSCSNGCNGLGRRNLALHWIKHACKEEACAAMMGTKLRDRPQTLELGFSEGPVPDARDGVSLKQRVVFLGQIVLGVVCIVQVRWPRLLCWELPMVLEFLSCAC